MDDPRSALLRAVNDLTTSHPYGDGYLVDLPLALADGDTVRVLIEPLSEGFRVTDRCDALDRLEMAGVRADSGRARNALRTLLRAAQLNEIGALDPREISTYGDASEVGTMILKVAQTAMQVDQLRWLAVDQPELRFDHRVAQRVARASGRFPWRTISSELAMKSGDTRKVTTAVAGPAGRAFVQAIGVSSETAAVEHCYYLFDRADRGSAHLVAALEGSSDSWRSSLVRDLQTVGHVAFYDAPEGLELELRELVGGVHEEKVPVD